MTKKNYLFFHFLCIKKRYFAAWTLFIQLYSVKEIPLSCCQKGDFLKLSNFYLDNPIFKKKDSISLPVHVLP